MIGLDLENLALVTTQKMKVEGVNELDQTFSESIKMMMAAKNV